MTGKKSVKYHGVTMPLWIFQCPAFSINTRVLLAYIKFMDKNHFSFPSANKVCVLIGLVGEDGTPTDKNIKAVRQARQQLIKKGVLTHVRSANTWGESRHRWRVNGGAVTDSCLAMMNAMSPNSITYVQRWAPEPKEGGVPTPSRATPPTSPGLPPSKKDEITQATETPRELPNIARDEDGAPLMDMDHLMRASDFNPWDLNLGD